MATPQIAKFRNGRIVGGGPGVKLPPDTVGADGWKDAWLKMYKETMLKIDACRAINIGKMSLSRARRDDPDFDEAITQIEERSTEVLEQICVRRAAEGSDQLMMFLLRARKPEIYRENVVVEANHNHIVGGEVTMSLTSGRQPIDIPAAKRREAARALLTGGSDEPVVDAEVVEDS